MNWLPEYSMESNQQVIRPVPPHAGAPAREGRDSYSWKRALDRGDDLGSVHSVRAISIHIQHWACRFTDHRPTPTAERLASEGSEYPASVVGRRNGCIRGSIGWRLRTR